MLGEARRPSTIGRSAGRVLSTLLPCVTALAVAGAASGVGSPSSPAARDAPAARKATRVEAKASAPFRATGILRYGETYTKASGYDRYAYVVVARHHAQAAARLPGMSLPYTSGTTVYPSWNSGVTYAEAVSNGWILKDGNGNPVTNTAFGGYVADVGDRGYQQRFVANQLAFLKRSANDGIFLDDVLTSPLGLGGAFPAKYPSNEAWENGMVSFVETVGQAIRGKGYYLLVNAGAFNPGDTPSQTLERYPQFFRRLAGHVDGLMMEGWMQAPGDGALRALGPHWTQNWTAWHSLLSVTQSAGADFFALTYGTSSNVRAMRYGRAAFLLDWSGRGGAYMYAITDRDDPYHPTWVRQHGKPLEAKTQRQPGVWQRRYEKATVVLNANAVPVTLRVAGTTFTIGPTDALFVRPPPRR